MYVIVIYLVSCSAVGGNNHNKVICVYCVNQCNKRPQVSKQTRHLELMDVYLIKYNCWWNQLMKQGGNWNFLTPFFNTNWVKVDKPLSAVHRNSSGHKIQAAWRLVWGYLTLIGQRIMINVLVIYRLLCW